MNRRQLLALSALTLPFPLSAVLAGEKGVAFSREGYENALAEGDPLLLAFNTTW